MNTEDKNSALTVQDVGHVMPGGECGGGGKGGEALFLQDSLRVSHPWLHLIPSLLKLLPFQ